MKTESLGDAIRCLLEHVGQTETEYTELDDACGRVCAEEIAAAMPVPPFARSAYDGYALRTRDTASATAETPVTLRVTELLAAGAVPAGPLLPGTAVRIMTGAAVPEGADAVVMHEKTVFTDRTVTLTAPVPPGNIVPPGEDVEAGTLLCKKGAVLSASEAALLAGQGRSRVLVFRKPCIGLISTGSELLSQEEPLQYGKIYNTNPYLIGGCLRRYGMKTERLGIVPDDAEALSKALLAGMEGHDLLITTGGVSAGDFDLMPDVIRRIGGTVLFHKLRFKPGGAMLAAEKDGKLILCLSGNPGAAATALLCAGLPCLKKLCGRSDFAWKEEKALLLEPFRKSGPVDRIVKGSASVRDGRLCFTPLANQRNGSVSSMEDCALLTVIPAGSEPLPAGSEIPVYIL